VSSAGAYVESVYFLFRKEPVACAWVQAHMDGVDGDFTAEMPESKAKTELGSVLERGLLGHIAASVLWVLVLTTRTHPYRVTSQLPFRRSK
jgi:hypothetical protein